jgi:CheY-like chemotaxis protein
MGEAAPDTRPVILYVEDDADTFRLAHLRLQPKYRLIQASSDREACAQFEIWGENLHAVLMDVQLQGSALDGLQLIRLLRGQLPAAQTPPYARRVRKLTVPIIVLTASPEHRLEAEARALGAAHVATKPIDFTRLNLALAQVNIQSVMAHLSTKAAGTG